MKLYNIVDYRNLKPCGELTKRTRLFTGYACNIKCKFCFYKGQKHVDIKDKIYEQLEIGKKYGLTDWDISGGEPSLLPYWLDILCDMKQMGFKNIACITNGYKFSNIMFLGKCMENGLTELLFSLHGKDRDSHDKLTGVHGSYDKIIKAISFAKYLNTKIRINVVVTKDNYKDLPYIAEYANTINPIAFNFLPFRIENQADKVNAVQYKEITPYIKKAIDILDNNIKIAVRFIPFCVMVGYEQYVAGYLQRMFDEYEWSEYCLRAFENARFNKNIPELDYTTDKWNLEINAVHESIKYVANHNTTCLKCKYLKICDGIWYSYADVWGLDEFKPIEGEKCESILPTINNV